MGATFQHLRGLSTAERAEAARAADAFDDAWQQGQARPPDLAAFLPAGPRLRRAVLIELACIDLGMRLKRGVSARVEDYLGRFPELRSDADAAWALVAEECTRRGLGPAATEEDYGRRFPEFTDRLRAWLCTPSLGPPAGTAVRGPAVVTTADPAGTAPEAAGAPVKRLAAGLPSLPGYEMLGVLGHGGMGVVYKARHLKLNRLAAVKMILSGPHAGRDELARFRLEAEAVARLDHPHIVQIYEVGEHAGRAFLVLEFCPGGGLDRKLAGAPLPPPEAARLVETLARAMHAAHGRGVVHRDLKPANVLLKEDGAPKITDFGLAKRLDDDSGRTRANVVMGTPSYMAPEQAAGKTREAGPAVDVYALGAILYECLTGRPPFRAATALDTLELVRSQEPVPPRRLQPKTPRDLETICLKCLQKAPARRYPTAEELAEDLRRFGAGEPIRARPAGRAERLWRWCGRNPRVAALAATVVLVLLAGTAISSTLAWVADGWANEADVKRKEADARKKEADANADQTAHRAYVSDLNRVQNAWEKDRVDLVRELLDGQLPEKTRGLDLRGFEWHYWDRLCRSEALSLRGDGHALLGGPCCFAFSPRGDRFALAGKNAVVVHDAADGRRLREIPTGLAYGGAVAYSADGRNLAFAGADGVTVYDLEAGRAAYTLGEMKGEVSALAYSPDGRFVAAATKDAVKLLDAANGHELQSLPATTVRDLAFSPTGDRLAAGCGWNSVGIGLDLSGRVSELLVWDTSTGARTLTIRPFREPVVGVAFSPDGRWLASASGSALLANGGYGEVKIWDAETGEQTRVCGGFVGAANAVAFSPSGLWLAAGCGDRTVRVWNVDDDGPPLTLRGHDASVLRVAFGGDGARLTSFDGAVVKVWDGASTQDPLTFSGHAGVPVFSPDGTRLAAAARGPTAAAARVWDVADGRELLTLKDGYVASVAVAYSPDGKRLASAGGDKTVRLWDATDGRLLLKLPGEMPVNGVAFSPDGKRVAAAFGEASNGSRPDQPGEVRVWETDGGAPAFTLKGHGGPVNAVAFSPDGRRLASVSAVWGQHPPPSEVKIWDAADGRLLKELEGGGGNIRQLRFSADGALLADFGIEPVKVWDVESGREVLRLEHGGTCVAFRPDGKRLAAEGLSVIHEWDLETGQEVRALKGHDDFVRQLAYSPDGKRLASASQDGRVKLWDAESGQELLSLQAYHAIPHGLLFSPDGRRLAAACEPLYPGLLYSVNAITVWDATDGERIAPQAGPAPGGGRRRVWWADDRRPVYAPDLGAVKPLLEDDFSDPKKGFMGAESKEEKYEMGYNAGRYVIRPKDQAGAFYCWPCPADYAPDMAIQVVGRAVGRDDNDAWGVILWSPAGDGRGFIVWVTRGGTVKLTPCPSFPKSIVFPQGPFRSHAIGAGDADNKLLLVTRRNGPARRLEIYVNGVAVCDPLPYPLFPLGPDERMHFSLAALVGKTGMAAEFKSVAVWPTDPIAPPPGKPGP